MITAKIKFGILLCCLSMRFFMFSMVFLMLRIIFNVFSMMFAKTSLLFCWFRMVLCETSMLLFVSVLCYETSMLLFVSVWCYAKPRCYYSCPYGVMRNLDAIIRVSNYVRLNPGLQRARPLWSGASDRLILPVACVADETKPRYSPSANQRPKACSAPACYQCFL